MSLSIQFSGWFQCRLATNPDPTDERRGASGTTFAFSGEPDLDGVIRLQDPVAPREDAPTIGVFVDRVRLDGQDHPDHPLLGGTVRLLGAPRYVGANGIYASSGGEAIDPFHLEIQGGGYRLHREASWSLDQPDMTAAEAIRSDVSKGTTLYAQRAPKGFALNSIEVRSETGISDPAAYRQARRAALEARHAQQRGLPASEARAIALARLEGRLFELSYPNVMDRRFLSLGFQLTWEFPLNAPLEAAVVLPEGTTSAAPWWVRFWMGGWDADGLCGYIRGTLDIPMKAAVDSASSGSTARALDGKVSHPSTTECPVPTEIHKDQLPKIAFGRALRELMNSHEARAMISNQPEHFKLRHGLSDDQLHQLLTLGHAVGLGGPRDTTMSAAATDTDAVFVCWLARTEVFVCWI